jgi:hypothetical protein
MRATRRPVLETGAHGITIAGIVQRMGAEKLSRISEYRQLAI